MAYVKADAWILQQIAATGLPMVGGTVSAYVWDTVTPLAMYTDSAGAGSATSFELNSLGMPQTGAGTAVDIFLSDADVYKFIIRDADGVAVGPTIGPVYPGGNREGSRAEFSSLEALRAYTGTYDYVTVLAANEGGTTGRMELCSTGTTGGTPTVTGSRFSALADGTFTNEGGYGFALSLEQQITQKMFADDWASFIAAAVAYDCDVWVDGTYNVASAVTADLSTVVRLRGKNNAVITAADDFLFNLSTGGGVKLHGIEITSCTSQLIEGTGDLQCIEFYGCPFTESAGIGDLNIDSLVSFKQIGSPIVDCDVSGTNYFCEIRAYIQVTEIVRSDVSSLTSTTSSCAAYLLGKTQLADQPNTGNYFVHHNLVDGISASLAGTSGEVHYLQLYGDYFEVDHNIIKNIHRNNGVGGNEGVEGIYIKMSRGSVDHNIMYKAGSVGGGNKAAMINLKGVPLDYAAVSDTSPRGHLITCSHNVCDAGDGTAFHNGIRAEGDYLSIHSNRTYHCYYGILYAGNGGTDDQVYDVSIRNNTISLTTGPAGIWLNFTGERVSIKDNDILLRAAVPLSGGDSYGVVYTAANRTGVLDDVSISGNKISGFLYGVYVSFDAITADKFRSQYNELDDVTYAYRFINPENATLGLVAYNDAHASSAFFYSGVPSSSYIAQRNNYNAAVLVT